VGHTQLVFKSLGVSIFNEWATLAGLLARAYNDDNNRQQNVNANNRPSNAIEMTLSDVLWAITDFILFLLLFHRNTPPF
jgi:hypothetical protein